MVFLMIRRGGIQPAFVPNEPPETFRVAERRVATRNSVA
jgi:hypothetical protein